MASAPSEHKTDAAIRKELKLLERVVAKHPKGQVALVTIKNRPLRVRHRLTSKLAKKLITLHDERKKYKHGELPVGVREFIESPKYMNKKGVIWPKVIDEIEEAVSGRYVEGVFTGGIGCAKSTAALYIQAYLLYQLSLMKSPHAEFGLDPASEIMIVFQSLNATVAQTVEFERFKEMLDGSPYFKTRFPYDRSLKSSMHFPGRIVVKPISGSDKAAIGQNVISGIIDEVNFMAVIQKSKKAADGGAYNQAVELYNSIVRRRESRFMQKGKVWGLLCLVSSARFPGQFTDQRKEAARKQIAREGHTTIYIYDKRAWDVMDADAPTYSYSGKWFQVFLGDASRKPRVLDEGDIVPLSDRHLVMDVPLEHRGAFDDDIYDSIRDICGTATLAAHPFIPTPEKVAEALGRVPSIFSREDCDFDVARVQVYPKRFVDLHLPRYVHCDLSQTSDSTGVAIGYVSGFDKIARADGEFEMLPRIRYDALLEVRPPKNGEIEYANIRGLLYKLRDLGLPIKWVSFDSFNSYDSIQILRQKGFVTGQVSMDTTPVPYEMLKQAIIDGRIDAPAHEKCQVELITLERDPATGKIDHTEVSSKDVADAMAGVAYGLTVRREIWASFGVNPNLIPKSVTDAVQGGKRSVEGAVAK